MKRWPQDLAVAAFAGLAVACSRAAGAQPFEDGPYVLGVAWQLAHELRAGELVEAFQHAATLVAPQPVGAYLPAVLGYTLFGPQPWVPAVVAWLLLWVVWDGLARLSRFMWPGMDLWGAFLAWLAVAGSALVLQTVEQLGVDLLLAACLAQAVSWGAASVGLGERRESLLAGAWVGACVLVKYSAPMLLLAPALLLLGELVRRRSLGHFFESAGLAAVVAAPFYLYNRPWIRDYLEGSVGPSGELAPSLDQALFYPTVLALAVGAPLALAGLAGAFRSAPIGLRTLPALGSAAGGLILLAVLELRHAPDPLIPTLARPEYALPCLFLGSLALLGLWSGHLRWVLGALVAGQALIGLGVYAQPRSGESMPPAVLPTEHLLGLPGPFSPPLSPPGRLPRVRPWSELAAALCMELPEGTLGLLFDDAHDSAAAIGRLLYESQSCGARWDLAQIEPRRGEAVALPFASRATPPEQPTFELVLQVALPNNPEHAAWLGEAEVLGRWELFEQRPGRLLRLSEKWPTR